MKQASEQFKDQTRWNQYGTQSLENIRENPDQYLITESPTSRLPAHNDLMAVLGDVRGKKILELGCGRGRFSVFLAKQGAIVTGMDLGHDLVAASALLAEVNGVDCQFQQGDISSLPFEDKSYDIVVGIAILHHLSEADVESSLRETHRVLKDGGFALFYEAIENSSIFDAMQKLIPVGKKGQPHYRPSMLERQEWAEYMRTVDERAMTFSELNAIGQPFQSVDLRPYGFLVRLARLVSEKNRAVLMQIDTSLFNTVPPLRYFCQTALVEYRK